MVKLKPGKQGLFKYFKKLLPLIGIAIFIYLIVNIGIENVVITILKVSPFHIVLAASITFPVMLLFGFQWWFLQRKQKIKISYLKSVKIFLIGYFYGSITPGFLGQHMRVFYLKKATNEPYGKLFTNSVILTTVNSLTIYIMAIIGGFLIANRYPNIFFALCTVLFVTVILCLYFVRKERGEKVFLFLIKLLVPKKIKANLRNFVGTFYDDFPRFRDFVFAIIIGILILMIIYLQIYILGLSLGIEIPYFLFIVLYPIADVVALIPVTPAGLGTREATLVFLFSLYGVAPEKAVAISLVGYMITGILPGFYGFLISLLESRNNGLIPRAKMEKMMTEKDGSY